MLNVLLKSFIKHKLLGNVSDVLLKAQQFANQYNTKELPHYFPLPTIEISVFQACKVLQIVRGELANYEL